MRWRRIAYEAAKQSRRSVIPKVEDIRDLNAIWSQINQLDINIVAYENERTIGIKDLINSQISPNYKNIGIFVGPEGGFDETEIRMLEEKGVFPISLGPRILRTETAGFVVVTILMYELGDIGGF